MKKIIFSLFLSMMTVAMMAQGMTDSQVAQFIQREMKAGTSQSQIVTNWYSVELKSTRFAV